MGNIIQFPRFFCVLIVLKSSAENVTSYGLHGREFTHVQSVAGKEIDVINTKKYIIDIIERLRLEYEAEHRNKEKQHSSNHNVGSAGND